MVSQSIKTIFDGKILENGDITAFIRGNDELLLIVAFWLRIPKDLESGFYSDFTEILSDSWEFTHSDKHIICEENNQKLMFVTGVCSLNIWEFNKFHTKIVELIETWQEGDCNV